MVLRFNPLGSMVYGFSTVAIDGTIPAALVGRTVGGPAWVSNTLIGYQDGGSGAGPWQLHQYNTSTLAVTTLSTSGASFFGAGNGIWAAFLAGSGVRWSIDGTTFPNASLGDVSALGQTALVDSYQLGAGLTVYDSTGTQLLALPTVSLVNPAIRLIGNVLAYQSSTGWHLQPLPGMTTRFAPQLAPQLAVIPVPMSDGTITVIEVTNSQLTARQSDTGNVYVVEDVPDTFWPDAMEISAGVVRIGWATNQGATADSAVYVDLTMSSGANTRATISGGAFVPVVQTPFTASSVSVGPVEIDGNDADVNARYPPAVHPMTDETRHVTKPWRDFLTALKGDSFNTQVAISKLAPTSAVNAFGTIASTGQPPIQATGIDTWHVESGPGITLQNDPLTKTTTISAKAGSNPVANRSESSSIRMIVQPSSSSGSSVDYVVLSNGVQPPTPVDDGAGQFIYIGYTP